MKGSVKVYTRTGCCLCEDVRKLLEAFGLSPEMIDIDGDAQLLRRFTDCVPVVEINGKLRFRGRVNEVLLRRVLVAEGLLHSK